MCCIGWLVCAIVGAYLIIKDLITTGEIYKSDIIFDFCVLIALFASTASGIYSFIIRHKKQWNNIKLIHATLETKIIFYIHFLTCVGWLIVGLWFLKDELSYITSSRKYYTKLGLRPVDYKAYMECILVFTAVFISTVSGIYLFLFSSEFWKHDFALLFRVKSQIAILWIGILLIVFMCLFPPFVSSSSTGYEHGYAFLLSDTISVDDGWREKEIKAHIDLERLIVQCAIVSIITGGLFYTLKYKKKD